MKTNKYKERNVSGSIYLKKNSDCFVVFFINLNFFCLIEMCCQNEKKPIGFLVDFGPFNNFYF